MNLNHLNDAELLSQTQQLVQNERQLLTQILHHLKEVEKRKLFADLGYRSLFEYAVKELKYSEGQAGRRIQAIRMIKELPEVEEKIADGRLSLSNLSQAQSYFHESMKAAPDKRLKTSEKLQVLESLENKSAREGQKILIKLHPQVALPKERERPLTESHTEVRFVMTEDIKVRLEELRALLGSKGATMSLAELISYMAQVSIYDLRIKKFGKSRALAEGRERASSKEDLILNKTQDSHESAIHAGHVSAARASNDPATRMGDHLAAPMYHVSTAPTNSMPAASTSSVSVVPTNSMPTASTNSVSATSTNSVSATSTNPGSTTPTSELQGVIRRRSSRENKRCYSRTSQRYISKAIQHQIWMRDQGRCRNCGAQRNLNIDHIKPIALGGRSTPENLRLLCFNCNQRQAIKIFGIDCCRRS